jgi:hypothetical protein
MMDSQSIPVAIALPGAPGQGYDFLNLFLDSDIDRVRNVLFAWELLEPTAEEIEEFRNRRQRKGEIERVAAIYPPPPGLEYHVTPDGEVWLHKRQKPADKKKTDETKSILVPICSPIAVPAYLRKIDVEEAYALRVVLEDMNGKARLLAINRSDLARQGASEIRARLMAVGLRVDNGGEFDVVAALKRIKPQDEIIAVSRTGRHTAPDGAVYFVSPGGRVSGDIKAGQAFELINRLPQAEAGTLKGWQEAVIIVSKAENCPHWVLALAAGFAGVLTDLCGLESHGMHLSGPSSLGKTTALKLAVSAWSSPKLGAGLLKPMLSTENAIEVIAHQSHGTIMALDEAASTDGVTFVRIIYMIAGNVGKSRMNWTDHSLEAALTWAIFGLSSGEQPISQKVAESGGRLSSGAIARWFSLDVSDVNPSVEHNVLNSIAGIDRHHGHAGPAFFQGLVGRGWHRDPEPVKQRIDAAARKLAGEAADGVWIRAAMPLAIISVAGQLATQLEILPELDLADAVNWAWAQFVVSREADTLDSITLAIHNLRDWIPEHWNTSIRHISDDRVLTRDAAGWYDDNIVYLPTFRASEAISGALSLPAFGRALKNKGLLRDNTDASRATVRWVPKVGKLDAYALKREEFHPKSPPGQGQQGPTRD